MEFLKLVNYTETDLSHELSWDGHISGWEVFFEHLQSETKFLHDDQLIFFMLDSYNLMIKDGVARLCPLDQMCSQLISIKLWGLHELDYDSLVFSEQFVVASTKG